MPETNQAEQLRLFELDNQPTPEERVSTFIEEHGELFLYTSEAWTAAVESERNSMALFSDMYTRDTQRRIERQASPKQEGWRIFETHMMNGRNTELTDVTDRMAYAKAVTEQYCEQATTMLIDRYTIGSRLGDRIIRTAEELQTLHHSIISQAQVACAYGMAFFAQTEAKRRLLTVAKDPQTAGALLERIKTEVDSAQKTPGLLEIIATDLAHKPDASMIYEALATKYADTPQQRMQIVQAWLANDHLPRRLRQETQAVLMFLQASAGTHYADTDTTAIERFAQRPSFWHPQLQTDYQKVLMGQRSAELKAFAGILDDKYIRRSRLPETRAFRRGKK